MRHLALLVGAAACLTGGTAVVLDPSATRSNSVPRVGLERAEEPATQVGPQERSAVFEGAGAWIDRYDQPLWDDPEPVLDTMVRNGVRTLYIQTSMSAEPYAIKEPAKLDRILVESHARGLEVVGWYLPLARRSAGSLTSSNGRRLRFVNLARDIARSKRAISYVSADGQHRFDGFALDIEPATGSDHGVVARERMLIDYSRKLRAHAGPDYPLGAIVPPPVFNTDNPRTSWKRFPWAGIAPHYDAWLPMLFFNQWKQKGIRVDRGFQRDVAKIRSATVGAPQLPVHVIGEVAADARASEHRQMHAAVVRSGAKGASYYDAYSSDRADWAAVARLAKHFAK